MITLNINNQQIHTELEEDTPLLWLLRDELGLTATKFGCGIGQCGACAVHLDGQAIRACSLPIGSIGKATIVTIEGENSRQLNALQNVWRKNSVPQCGYCQVGQLMSASSLLSQNTSPSEAQIDNAMAGNICRCGTYSRIKQSIKEAAYNLAVEAD
jgi:isoquinoline 1-oxidoreductase alpha subunit